MVFTPDGTTLAAGAAGGPGAVGLWNVTTAKRTATLPTGYVLALSPDGRTLATSGEFTAGHKASLWSVPTAKHLAALAAGRPLGFSGDGRLLALISRPPPPLSGPPPQKIRTVSFSADGAALATAAENGTVRIWILT
ncbi:WD40 repeat domain-containing protein [Streptomyces roseirectus]|uniref:WD40 repeat domain-containing protein n=2 Tax=Streptomyces roseirectus TaxID=2768066 RepID=A0A7H0I7P8_9ACTN|nr:WD40 repeat domain-containing protein [Streptomyces roseirectus]QNP68814.1 WD40 repeat domain-containing protein [Streptomyces roseirectus]